MIEKLILRDFLSHSDTEAVFTGSTIAVVGDNGCGKSALLEAIPYAYFGLGRETKEGMSRIHGDGSHTVELWETGGTVISRGRKSSGAGFCEVRVGGELVSRGKEADEWIVSHLGMDADTFMLTVFFGLGDSHTDKLLGVTPSARLETLQGLAQIGPYRAFHSKAKLRLADSERRFDTAEARKEGAESALEGVEDLQKNLSRYTKEQSETAKLFKGLRLRRGELQDQEEVYRAFVSERERVSVERRELRREIDGLSGEVEDYEAAIAGAREALSSSKSKLESILGEELPSIEDVDSRLEDTRNMQSVMKTHIQLREFATKLSLDDAVCPLCEQPVKQETIDSWESEIDGLRESSGKLQADSEELSRARDQIHKNVAAVDACRRDIVTFSSKIETATADLERIRGELRKLGPELSKKDDRYVLLTEKLGDEYSGLQKSLENVSNEMDECQRRKHSAEGAIDQLKESLERAEKAKKLVSVARAEMAQAKTDGRVAAILRDAWSRYGIPLRLVNRLNTRIEERATAMYQEFDNGRVEVREVEDRGRPGVQFYLVDRKGDRTYSQLSMGEKVMFFISIRVAIAYIVAEDSPITVDFLVLDEALGNLSPGRREDMVRLVNKSLRKMFPQVILVTHTTIPEIFDRSIEVTMQNDTSIVRGL